MYGTDAARVQALSLEFPDLEDFGPAIGAEALDRRAAIFHGHLFGVFDLDLLPLFDAVTLGHKSALLSPPLRGSARVAREVD
jgi:hypothetical protein